MRPFSSTWHTTTLYNETVDIAVHSFGEDSYRCTIYRHALMLLVDLNVSNLRAKKAFIKRDHIPLFSPGKYSQISSRTATQTITTSHHSQQLICMELLPLCPQTTVTSYIYLLAFEPGLRGLWHSISKRTVITPTKTGGGYCMFKLWLSFYLISGNECGYERC